MKRVVAGIFLGLAVGAVVFVIVLPRVKEQAYNNGYAIGNKEGLSAGKSAGITEGIAQVNAHLQHERDSVAAARNQALLARQRAAKRMKKVEKPIQNWHVINGQLGDPIPN